MSHSLLGSFIVKRADAREAEHFVQCEHCHGQIVPKEGDWLCLSCGCTWDAEWEQTFQSANCPVRIAGVIASRLTRRD